MATDPTHDAPAYGAERPSFEQVRRDFPALHQQVGGEPLTFLDSAASSQIPQPVLDALVQYHSCMHANVHRGVHTLSQRATALFEGARESVRRFINAREAAECIFVRGATEGVNLVVGSFGRDRVGEGDRVLVSAMEHHSNMVPWQQLCAEVGAQLDVLPMSDDGELLLDELDALLTERTKLVSLVHVSNALGTVNPVEYVIEAAHAKHIPVMLDGCQATAHMPVDVQALGVDFYTFSGHKMFAPTGIGVLYGKREHLDAVRPYQYGGDMVDTVRFERTTFDELPYKFEAGTPSIAAAVALGAAVEYLERVGMDRVWEHDQELLRLMTERFLAEIPGARIFGTAALKSGVLSFDIDGIHPHDIGTILDSYGVAVRTGQHCAEPVMEQLGVSGTARASIALYNDASDVDRFIEGLLEVVALLG
ncbi:MAG: SufS family cysteine desulfurase [Myxococcota bacterium]